MANIDQAEANRILSATLALAGYTATVAPVKLKLTTTVPSATVNGTEVTGGGYVAGGQSLTAALGVASAGSVTTTGAVTYTNMPAVTVSAVEIWDAAPTRKWFASVSSKTTNAGDTLSFAASSVVVGVS